MFGGIFPDEAFLLQPDCNFHQPAQLARTILQSGIDDPQQTQPELVGAAINTQRPTNKNL
jgi:hypothetical protein